MRQQWFAGLVLALSSLAVSAYAVETTSTLTRVGVLGGIDLANASLSDASAGSLTTTRTGLLLGVNAEFPLTDGFFIQPELQYAQQGVKATNTVGALTSAAALQYDSLKLPIFAKYQAPVAPGIRLFVMAGPSFGLAVKKNINVSASGTVGGVAVNASADGDASNLFNSFDFAIDGGVGAEFEITPTIAVAVTGRYSLGLTNVLKSGGSATVSGQTITAAATDSMKTRDVMLAANVFFTL